MDTEATLSPWELTHARQRGQYRQAERDFLEDVEHMISTTTIRPWQVAERLDIRRDYLFYRLRKIANRGDQDPEMSVPAARLLADLTRRQETDTVTELALREAKNERAGIRKGMRRES